MSGRIDIAWSRELAATSRRQLVLWSAAAMVTFATHAGAAWLATRPAPEPPIPDLTAGAIEIELAAFGFAEADQLAAGEQSEPVEPVTTETAQPVETLTTAVALATPTQALPVEVPDRPRPVAATVVTSAVAEPVPEPRDVEQASPVEQQPTEATPPPAVEAAPIESSRPSEVTIAAASPVQPVEPPPIQPETRQAVPVPSDEARPVEEATEVAALVHVPLPTPRPDYTPAVMPRAEPAKPVEQRRAEQPRQKPAEKPPEKKAQTAPPKKSGSGGQNQADARKGVAEGQAQGRSTAENSRGQQAAAAGNAAVTTYPGKVRSKLRRALRRQGRESGEVLVSFTVDRSGRVSGARVSRSSGSAALDKAALDTVHRAAPFPPIPDAAGRSSWPFDIPLAFSR